MDIARLVLEYLQALLWPGITITAILIFRKQLRQLLANIGSAVHRVRKLTAPGTTVELIDELSQKVELIDLELSTEKDEVLPSESPTRDADNGTDTVDTQPDEESLDDLTMGKIIRIWNDIDMSLQKLARTHAPWYVGNTDRRLPANSPDAAIRLLRDKGIITADSAESLRSARSIRNHVVHGFETIPLGSFDDYLRTISKLNEYLKNVIELM